uniref:ATP synthase subunit a n=1 Tax=Mekongiana xiangchengensis TaxID=868576 RepID=E1ABS8_9ORTH|nr:ATP synthase F0 subunit 6 [Mekongiana xiangchengensis]ADK77627.1 ATP synthase F0 subunit 6 [Mekongiana xiangchengensis]
MMTNLFSTFDPSTSLLNTSIKFDQDHSLDYYKSHLYIEKYHHEPLSWNKLNLNLHNEFKTLIGMKSFNGTTFIFIFSIFIMMMFNNFMGLFPFFTSTSHLVFTLSIALPMWLSFMLFGWINNTKFMLAHLVPQGTPMALMSFMVLIETISNVIRPGTLAVRLAANMIAGHLLLTLLGNTGPSMNLNVMMVIIIISQMLFTLESAVALNQAYAFSILSTLYSSESY